MTMVLLHLSDIHIKRGTDQILKRAPEIAAAVFSAGRNASHVFIVVSGDIAYGGEEHQYIEAGRFLTDIRNSISVETKCPVTVVLAPGNHDCNFNRGNATRDILVNALTGANPPAVDDSIVESCTVVQSAYFDFARRFEPSAGVDGDQLWRTLRFDVEGKQIVFDTLNLSWVSKLEENPGNLYFPLSRYTSVERDDATLRLVVMHHPLNWLSQAIYRPLRTFVHRLGDVLITGHEHEGNVGVRDDAESEQSAFIEGCVLQSDGRSLEDSSFNLVVIDLQKGQFKSTRHLWTEQRYAAVENGTWSSYHDLPGRRQSGFVISGAFSEQLDDPGPYFAAAGRRGITLSDIFVYPALRKVGAPESGRNLVDSARLLISDSIANGVVLEGGEKTGRTSLLHQLYREYYDRGLVPVLIRGRDVRKASDDAIDSVIARAVDAQYGKSLVEPFEQLQRSRKLLLLDDRGGSAC